MKNSLRLTYEYRSGLEDDPQAGFDILWGRYFQHTSNLLNYYLAPLETLKAAPSNDPAVYLKYHLVFKF